MSNIQVQLRRGTTAQHGSFTGAQGELTVDTDKNALVLHDGSTVGGIQLARGSVVNVLDFIPPSEHAAIKSGTSTYNATADIQAAIDSGAKSVYMPSGIYKINSELTPVSNQLIYGDGISPWNPFDNSQVTTLATGNLTEVLVTNHTAFNLTGLNNTEINGIAVRSSTATTNTEPNSANYTAGAIGFDLTQGRSCRIKNVSLSGLEYGVAVAPNNTPSSSDRGGGMWQIDGFTAVACKVVVRIGSSSTTDNVTSDSEIRNCIFANYCDKMIECYQSDGLRIASCRFFKSYENSVHISGTPFLSINDVTHFETGQTGFLIDGCSYVNAAGVGSYRAGEYTNTTIVDGVKLNNCTSVAWQGVIERPNGRGITVEGSNAVTLNLSILQPYRGTSMLVQAGENGCIDVKTSTQVNINASLDTVSTNNIYSVTSDFASMEEITGSISSNDYANVSRAYNIAPDKLLISHVMEADQAVNAASSVVVKTQRVLVPDGNSLVSRSTHFSSGSPDFVARVGANFWTTGNVANADGGSSNFTKKTLVTNSTGSDAYYDIELSIYNNGASAATLVQGTRIFLSMGLE